MSQLNLVLLHNPLLFHAPLSPPCTPPTPPPPSPHEPTPLRNIFPHSPELTESPLRLARPHVYPYPLSEDITPHI
eukprot:752504-Hanusia_phi.AAC.3